MSCNIDIRIVDCRCLSGGELYLCEFDQPILLKSINLAPHRCVISCTRICGPRLSFETPYTSFPSMEDGEYGPTVPLEARAGLQLHFELFTILDSKRIAAADLLTCRSTLLAASSPSVQCLARTSSSLYCYLVKVSPF